MKIILTANTSWYLLKFRLALIRRFIQLGHEVVIIAPRDAWTPHLARESVKVCILEMSQESTNLFREISVIWNYFKTIRKLKPDTVFSFTVKPNLYCGLLSRVFDFSFVPTVTGLGTSFIKKTTITHIIRFMYRIGMVNADTVFFQNNDDRRKLERDGSVRPDQIRLVAGSGIDVEQLCFSKKPQKDRNNEFVFVMIARLILDKGVIEYCEAARTVVQKFPSVRCILVGPIVTNNRTALTAGQIIPYTSDRIIEYLGELEDVSRVIEGSDCVVLPSYREGLPRVLLEAAAIGRPVVASKVPGCNDVIVENETGLLCEPRNSEDLSDKMLQIMAMSAAKRYQMGVSARRRVEEHFDVRVVNDAYENVLGLGRSPAN